MAIKGMLINYNFCTGCHSCEMACRQEYGYEIGNTGIVVNEVGPNKITKERWQLDYVPVPTDRCTLCAGRAAKGKLPACVQNCQSRVIEVGDFMELAGRVDADKQVLYAVR